MNVLITGGTGLIGSRLTKSLLDDGHKVWVLTRRPDRANIHVGAQPIGWDAQTTDGWGKRLSEMDAVVNLVGATIGRWPWTESYRHQLIESRVGAGKVLAEAIRESNPRPKVLIQASGINYYGRCGLEHIDETAPSGNDFLSRLSVEWEASTQSVEEMGVRRVVIRTAIVLEADEGILPVMALPVRLFVAGPLGGGRQGLPWIHMDDEIGAIRMLMDDERAQGVFNLCAPDMVSSGQFMRALAKSLHRPYWFPVPAFALKLVLGGMSETLLHGQFARPGKLISLGYAFKYPDLQQALKDIYALHPR